MGRQPAREQRLTAQRASAEFREQVTSNAELLRRIGELEEELRQTKNYRNNALNTVTQLKEELDKIKPPSLDGRRTSIPKLKDHTAKTFYEHVDLIYRNLRRYDSSDIAALTSAAVNKLSRERKEDFAQGLLRAPGLKSARDTLLHDHELKIADHLKLEVLTSAARKFRPYYTCRDLSLLFALIRGTAFARCSEAVPAVRRSGAHWALRA